jgi:hypothetical protein
MRSKPGLPSPRPKVFHVIIVVVIIIRFGQLQRRRYHASLDLGICPEMGHNSCAAWTNSLPTNHSSFLHSLASGSIFEVSHLETACYFSFQNSAQPQLGWVASHIFLQASAPLSCSFLIHNQFLAEGIVFSGYQPATNRLHGASKVPQFQFMQ